jgi:hypothetical protein
MGPKHIPYNYRDKVRTNLRYSRDKKIFDHLKFLNQGILWKFLLYHKFEFRFHRWIISQTKFSMDNQGIDIVQLYQNIYNLYKILNNIMACILKSPNLNNNFYYILSKTKFYLINYKYLRKPSESSDRS